MFGFNWIIQLKSKEDAKLLKSLRSVLGQGIKVENYKGKKVIQCKNCQRYNHIAINCKMPYRCVKCGLNHQIGVCSIPKKEENTEEFIIEHPDGTKSTRLGRQLKCANCSGEHAASYTQCPARPKKEEPKQIIQPVRVQPINNNQALRRNNVSYSQATQSVQNSPKFDLNAEVISVFGKNLTDCLKKINNFIPSYKETKDITTKRKELCQLLFDLCLN